MPGAPTDNQADWEEGEGRVGYQPAADAGFLANYVRMMTKNVTTPEYAGPTLGNRKGGGGREDQGGEGEEGEERIVLVEGVARDLPEDKIPQTWTTG